jgi:soluble lytic murein transglycosylase-like protein
MSTALTGVASSETSADELAAMRRIQQIQSLAEQASGQVGTSSGTGASSSFAAALQTAESPTATATATASASSASGDSSQYDQLIQQAALRNGVDPAILHGLIQQESGFDPNATSGAGAQGLTQLMPGTASSLGVANPLDPEESIEGGARYLSQMISQFAGNTTDALAAYNAGAGAVQRYGGVPPYAETQEYVAKVMANAETYRATGAIA